jgi:hypothetical protein
MARKIQMRSTSLILISPFQKLLALRFLFFLIAFDSDPVASEIKGLAQGMISKTAKGN